MSVTAKPAAAGAHIFLTGGTGFLGSFLGAEFLRLGYDVTFLIRPNDQGSASARLHRILDWHGIDADTRARAHAVAGDITAPHLDIAPEIRAPVGAGVERIVHCASNTDFGERKREAITAVNVQGLRNLLDFAAESRCTAFHHISTAYVAGRCSGHCPETLPAAETYHNAYEETKAQAEWLVWKRCRAAGIARTIYRPTIVYGHAATGRTLRFDALYYPVRTALFLKRIYESDIRDHGGRKAAAMGVRLDDNGDLYLPVRVRVAPGGGLNLIPVDYFVAAFLALMDAAQDGDIFHIANDHLTRIEDLIAYTTARFGVQGIRPCTNSAYEHAPPNALESLVARYLDAYAPYMQDTRTFDMEHSRPILEHRGITCPELDYEMFSRCMDYAIEVGWRAGGEESA